MPILCGTDLSAASTGALDVALALAAQRGDRELVLLHVVDPDAVDGGDDVVEAALGAARAAIATLATARAGAVLVRPEVRVGPADATLVATAETENADLLIIAGGDKLGATALSVISTATVPVIVVRDPAPWLAYAQRQAPLRLLLGVDDSAVCDLGIQWLHGMRARGPIDVVLGAVYYPDDAAERYGLAGKALVDRDPEVEQLLSRDLVRRFGAPQADAAAGGSIAARTRRGLGRIGDHVLELATEEGVHAIVIGTNQRTGLGRLGSVSTVVVHDAKQSVVCVPPGAALGPARAPLLENALVATDFSPFANRAIPYAFAVVPPTGEVHLLHVADDDEPSEVAELNARLAALAPAGAAHRVVTHVVRGADAAVAIAQAAARFGVDVICIASHGRSGLSRALVGSVADRLLRATRLPVLVLRPS